ncbi:hypothetical protein EJ02DRAFT_457057 [Clathrospora elynae]|uniref:Uncharacterized protein n=1 Tax=Clathrospora elynae TaxID=706981 RepID=A0A6A5SHY1_9PLEO|nr:hypothetical protein EJ02DRAFT_457057 [Clathrospora elynae]
MAIHARFYLRYVGLICTKLPHCTHLQLVFALLAIKPEALVIRTRHCIYRRMALQPQFLLYILILSLRAKYLNVTTLFLYLNRSSPTSGLTYLLPRRQHRSKVVN